MSRRPALPPSNDFASGFKSLEITEALARYVRRPGTPRPAVDPVLEAHLGSVTDEEELRRLYQNIPEDRGRRDWGRRILDQMARVALDGGHSWTHALDQLVDSVADVNGPASLPPQAYEAYRELLRYMETAWTRRDLRRTVDMDSEWFRRARASHMRTHDLTPAEFRTQMRTLPTHRLWQNPGLTAAQRELMVEAAIRAVKREPLDLPNGAPLAFLGSFLSHELSDLLQEEDGGRHEEGNTRDVLCAPAPDQLHRLAEAVAQKRRGRLPEGGELSYVGHVRDMLILLSVPNLPASALALITDVICEGAYTATPAALHDLMFTQAALPSAAIVPLLGARRLSGHGVEALIGHRPGLLADRAVRRVMARDFGTATVLRRLVETAEAAEVRPLFNRLANRAPATALEMMEQGDWPSGVAPDTTWLTPLLRHASQSIRTRAIMLTAPGAIPTRQEAQTRGR